MSLDKIDYDVNMNNEEAIDVLSKIQRRIRLWFALSIISIILSLVFVVMFVETINLQYVVGSVASGITCGISIYAQKIALHDFAEVGKKLNEEN